MRSDAASGEMPSGCWAAGYPAPSDGRPIYMYGVFPARLRLYAPGERADQAMLGLRQDAGAARPGIHSPQHTNLPAGEGHRFMFGVAVEQAPVATPAEPAFCFWHVGTA